MLSVFLNIIWKNQNWLGKLQTVLIAVLIGLVIYYKESFGIFKRKYVGQLEKDKIELLQEVEDIKFQKTKNQSRIRINTQNLQSDKDKIEQKRQQDEKIIYSSTITEQQRNAFISKYENR